MHAEAIRRVAVIGAGQMGCGIAQVAWQAGYDTRLCDASLAISERAQRAVWARLERAVEKGLLTAAELQTRGAELAARPLEAAVQDADLVIEAAPERLELKLDLFTRLDTLCPPSTCLASNTSSISITRLAAATRRPEQVVGIHFMNPVPLMHLVELVHGLQTSPATLELGREFAARLGKTVIVSADRPGFVVNRMLLPFLNEACFAVSEGVATVEDFDAGARLGLNHPLGPLELADLIGLDTVLSIAEVLQRDFGDAKYRPAPLLRNLVAAGYLGKKVGRGFYVYEAGGHKRPAPLGSLPGSTPDRTGGPNP